MAFWHMKPAYRRMILSSFLLGTVPAHAASTLEATLPEMDVTGDQAPERYRLKDTRTDAKISRESFEHQPQGLQVGDVLQRMPGVIMGGGPGENKEVRLRGLDKEYTRTQIDGVQLPDGGEKREMNIDRLPTALIEEVTIVRNNTAEEEGDGIAGRVHLKTRDIPLEETWGMSMGTGDIDKMGTQARQVGAHYGNRFADEKYGFQGMVNYYQDPQYKTKYAYGSDGVLKTTEMEDKPLQSYSLFLDGAVYGENVDLHIKPMYVEDHEDKVKPKTTYKADGSVSKVEKEVEDKIRRTVGLGLSHRYRITEGRVLDSDLGYYRTTESKDKTKYTLSGKGVEDVAKREIEDEDKHDGFWQGETKLTQNWNSGFDNRMKVGAKIRLRDREKEKEKYKADVLQEEAKANYDINEDYYAAFVQNEFMLTRQFSLLPGMRFEHVDLKTGSPESSTQSSTTNDFLPSLTARYTVSEPLSLHAAVSRVLNRPKFDELTPYIDDSNSSKLVLGNPDLDPARAWAWDAGFDYVESQWFFGANGFYRRIKDVLESRPTGEEIDGIPVYQTQNVGDGYLYGVELEQRLNLGLLPWKPLEQFTLTTNQTLINSKLYNDDGTYSSFKEQPDYVVNWVLDWHQQSWGTRASVALRQIASLPTTLSQDARDTEQFLDARIEQALTDEINVFFNAKNLTDEERVTHKSDGSKEVESYGRQFFLGGEWKM